ncbi:HD domain-containing protein [Phyllobacterium sp. CCNWLW109]|uniref:HD domain-containing protein n=1 Tax=Phyllobacterium sp. CCNWLW109 TaxID=3127479 RepID=UPI003076EC61
MVQRIRDPLHDIVEFSTSELERILWKAMQTRPFQRLRRVKQLGFSDLVYPGASHSRFAHSVGVFHTARQLMEIIRLQLDERQSSKETTSLAAALVHDLGHGPFSHAFEEVGKRLKLKLANHEDMSDILIRDSEVTGVLNELGSGTASDTADIILKGGVKTVHHAVVSSQFDADRLDYMRRDRLMTGTQHSAIDFPWLMANLEIGSVPIGVDDVETGKIDTLVLGPKSVYAAEAFVLGLFQLYPTVYFHKTTRGAEKLFSELLVRAVELARMKNIKSTGLPKNHPLIKFALNPEDVDIALSLDDTVIWGALSLMCEGSDPLISEYACRLRDRKLFKCVDIRNIVSGKINPKSSNDLGIKYQVDVCCKAIDEKIDEWKAANEGAGPRVLKDEATRSPYKSIEISKGPLDRINIRTSEGLIDLKERSAVVAALQDFKLFRAYISFEDSLAKDAITKIVEGEIETCLKQKH